MPKIGTIRKKTVRNTWLTVFEENEERSTPLTDEQIVEEMCKEFPHLRSTKYVHRVGMMRSDYNRGSGMFKGMPPAGRNSLSRPWSYRYDESGNVIPQRQKAAVQPEQPAAPSISEDRVRSIAREEAAAAERPNVTVKVGDKVETEMPGDRTHKSFAETVRKVSAGVPILLVGPAGSGKTFLAGQIAESLQRRFTFNSMSEGVNESSLLGRVLPDEEGNWTYRPSPFVTTFREGGVHLFDEVDAADPNLMVVVNAAIANGKLSIPFSDEPPIERHDDTVLIAAANTFGNGADRQYVGRNQLDAATVNRFTMGTIEVGYDRDLERSIAESYLGTGETADGLLHWAWRIRDRIDEARLRRIMSTRNIEDAARLIRVGDSLEDVQKTFLASWSEDERRKVAV